MKLEFYRRIFVKYSDNTFMKARPVGAEFFRADRQTDTTKLIVVFRNFAKAPKNPVFDVFLFLGGWGGLWESKIICHKPGK
jgi:hypothetical protein